MLFLLATSEQPSGRAGTKPAYCSETEPVVDGLHREPATVDGARMKEVGRVGEDGPLPKSPPRPVSHLGWLGDQGSQSSIRHHRPAAVISPLPETPQQ